MIRASGTESKNKDPRITQQHYEKNKVIIQSIEIVNTSRWIICISIKTRIQFYCQKICIKTNSSKCNFKDIIIYCIYATNLIKTIVETRGSGVYAHLKELRQLDFINHQNVGRLKIYTTTEKFQKYFGIQGDVEDLKQRLFSKVRKTASMRNKSKAQSKQNSYRIKLRIFFYKANFLRFV